MKLTGFKVLTFDCYGTLIDWERGIVTALAPLTNKVDHDLTRDQILEAHARHESSQQRQTPTKNYQALLATVYRRLAEEWGVSARWWGECVQYGQSVRYWPTLESMFHDHAPAKRHGLASCWIYRRYAQEGFGATMPMHEMPTYQFQFNSTAEMVEAHKAEING